MSEYKGYQEQHAKAYKKYVSKLSEVKVRMKPEEKEEIQKRAKKEGLSMNKYIIKKALE